MTQKAKGLKWLLGSLTVLCLIFSIGFASFAVEKIQLGETERAWWSTATVARWRKVDNAKRYEVRLYEDGDYVKTRYTNVANIDFASDMKDGRNYYFEVRAVAATSQKNTVLAGDWVESEYQDAEAIGDVSGRWRDYQEGKKYTTSEGIEVVNQWHFIGGQWFYFDAAGFMKTGWQQIDNTWYYLGTDGVMQTGWQQINNVWYFMKSSGAMATGWVESKPGQWYYMNADGSMATDTVVDGRYISNSGLASN